MVIFLARHTSKPLEIGIVIKMLTEGDFWRTHYAYIARVIALLQIKLISLLIKGKTYYSRSQTLRKGILK